MWAHAALERARERIREHRRRTRRYHGRPPHGGGAERETASQMVEDLEAAMTRYNIEYEALGALYEGGATFYEWRILG